jgi:hypothetical protein
MSPQKLLFCYHLPTRGRVGVKLGDACVTSQDFIKFWGKFFAFIFLVLIEISQGFKTF